MLIISWNVAGLSTTVQRIHDAYRPSSTSSSSTSSQHPASALAHYLERHGGDIVCLQEHKISKSQLVHRSEPRLFPEGYESFWACCVDESKKGLNGVVTYCRTGTVLQADSNPLGDPDLDRQGRCVMTDHGNFVLFNVYVPASGGQPLAYKLKFLRALRRAMQRQRRQKNKPVILVGDLNIAYSENDIYWKDRVVHVQDILTQVRTSTSSSLPPWKRQLARHWNKIQTAMQTKEVIPTQTTNTFTKETYNKFRLTVTVNDNNNKRVFLGKNETDPSYCLYCYDFSNQHYEDEETGEYTIAQEADVVRIQILAELMSKIAGVHWDEDTQRVIANNAADATIRRASPTRQWLRAVLEEDGMIDTFRYFYPEAQARFTCWHQFTNRRYVNDGSRIDYTLVDASLLPHILKETFRVFDAVPAPATTTTKESRENPLSEEAALRAATANGRFRPVSFEGGGIHEATQEALDTQFGPPHTGMIYTPPSFSDHIAVSLLLTDTDDTLLIPRDLKLNDKDAATRKAQPHKQQKSIASFFSSKSSSSTLTSAAGEEQQQQQQQRTSTTKSSTLTSSTTAKRFKALSTSSKKKKPAPANSILNHFAPKKMKSNNNS